VNFRLATENIRDEEDFLWYFTIGMFFLGLIGVFIIYLWEKAESFDYILSLFTLNNIWADLLSGLLVVGIFQIYVSILIKYNRGNFPNTKDSKLLVDIVLSSKYSLFVVASISAIFEEFFFRAALLGILATSYGKLVGFLIVTIFFGSLHIPQYKGQYHFIAYIFIFGASLNLLFLWTGTIWGPLLAHFLNNYLNFRLLKIGKIKIGN